MKIGQEFKPCITPKEQLELDMHFSRLSSALYDKVDNLVWFNGFSNTSRYPSKHKTLYCSLEDRLVFSEMGIWDEDRYIEDRMWPRIHYDVYLNKEGIWY